MYTKLFGDIKYALGVILVLGSIIKFGSGFNTEWNFLLDDLIADYCPSLASSTYKIKDLSKLSSTDEEESAIPKILVSESIRCGRELSRAAAERGNKLVRSGVDLDLASPAMLHFFSKKLSPEAKKSAEKSHEIITATKLLQMKVCSSTGVTPNTFMSFLENNPVQIKDTAVCRPISLSCRNEKYRSIDGTCNNLQNSNWGRKDAPFTRIATPRYADGIYSMPVATSGGPLPNPRVLSTRLFFDQPIPSRVYTYMNMQWGQFITHDMVYQIMETTDEGGIQCCMGDGTGILPPELLNDKCIPICVQDDDPFYRYHGIRCLNFVRSVTTPRDDCTLGYAEQLNTVTNYLDGSQIYGSDKKVANKLRSKRGGCLLESKKRGCKRGFPPSVEDKAAVCDLRNMSEPCYLAGDGRINQTPGLAVLHTLMVREHNRIADVLSGLNPKWSDEKLYQEAKRIVVAELQHITYQEWLPLNFGENYLRYYRISPSTLYSYDYNEDVNPGVINSFAAAAFRYLHTLIADAIMTCPADYRTVQMHKLSDHYFNPSLLEDTPTSFDDLVRGIVAQSSAESDPHCTGEITNLLFKSCNKWGMDLIAMDIQRGRDHGLAGYNDYREICGLKRAKTFQDFASEMSQDHINALAMLYESVDDVDLYVGGFLERDVPGSMLGHTFQCIVAEQFYRTRVGDRFFYDNSEMPHSFTTEQLKEIKKASIARLICDNTDGVEYVQRRAFEMETSSNPKYSCADYKSIPKVDLMPWKEL